jgi:beta-lactam-binding protein with PASTA domain
MRDFFWKVSHALERAREWMRGTVEWLRDAHDAARDFVRRVLPNAEDTPETRNLKLTIFLFVGIIGLMIIIGSVTFSIAVRGQEETLVPDVQGRDVLDALIDLQKKELYPDIQVQFSSDIEKGIIINQKPAPGTLVKAGKRVTLRVSKGPVIDKVENYVGMSLEEVKIHLQTLFSTHSPNLLIREPILFRFEKGVAPGRVLAQNPKPGTRIGGRTYLDLVVSQEKGSETTLEVGDYIGQGFLEAITALTRSDVPFVFTVEKAAKGKEPGIVTAQNPGPGEKIGYGRVVQLTMTAPTNIGKDKVFGLFRFSLPEQPIAVDIRLEIVGETERVPLLAMKHPGGPLAVPYIVPEGSELALTVLDQEAAREKAVPIR